MTAVEATRRRVKDTGSELVKQGLAVANLRVRRSESGLVPIRIEAYRGRDAPDGAPADLSTGDPVLADLRERYAAMGGALAAQSVWTDAYRRRDLRLERFRGDNVFLWQGRTMGANSRTKYYLYARYVSGLDTRGLLGRLREDGRYGCWTQHFETMGTVSVDLLDSINELYFLDRACGLFSLPELAVLDVGAGYGRLARRAVEACPNLRHYICADGIPESTYTCGWYLAATGATPAAEAVALDRLADRLSGERIDLAVAVHSLSEMPYTAVEAWLRLVAEHDIPRLMIVPNRPHTLTSIEANGARLDYGCLLDELGYRLRTTEPVIADPDVRELLGIGYAFYYFER